LTPTRPEEDTKGHNGVIRKVRKTQHENLEFGHAQGWIQKNLQKSTLAFNWG
jgi:hypothetical protein